MELQLWVLFLGTIGESRMHPFEIGLAWMQFGAAMLAFFLLLMPAYVIPELLMKLRDAGTLSIRMYRTCRVVVALAFAPIMVMAFVSVVAAAAATSPQ